MTHIPQGRMSTPLQEKDKEGAENAILSVGGLCSWHLACMTAEDERNEPSRDQKIAADVVQQYFRGAS